MIKGLFKNIILPLMLLGMALAFGVPAQAAVLYTGSANQVVYVDETFVVEWYLDTEGLPINTLSLSLLYAPEYMEATDVSVGGSVVDFWVDVPEINKDLGRINLVGGMAGVSDQKLNIIKTTFKPLKPGHTKLSLDSKSEVLVSDGQGTSAPLTFNEVNFVINPASAKIGRIRSSTHADQSIWHKNPNVEIVVDTKPEEEYSYSFSSNLEIFPGRNAMDVPDIITFTDLPDGVYYFKLNSRPVGSSNNWLEAGVYRVMIDTTPPEEFVPAVAQDPSVFDGQPFVSFATIDNVSGVAYYEVKSNFLEGWERTENNYFKLPGLVLGDMIEVKVVDAAGNARVMQVQVDKSLVKPYYYNPIFWGIILILIVLVVLLIRYYLKLLRKHKTNDI